MEQFLNEAFSFPLVLFSVPLTIFIMFWLTTLLGLMDIEMLDFGSDGGDADTGEDGAASSFMQKLGLDGVPLLVSLTFVDLYAWLFTYVGKRILTNHFSEIIEGAAQGTILAFGAVALAIPLAALSIRPLRRMFVTHEAPAKNDLTGTVCTLMTSKITASFGQAETEDGSMVLNVRADEPNEISKGDRLILLGYDVDVDRYDVITETEFEASFKQDYSK